MNLFLAFDWIPAHQLNMKLATSALGTERTSYLNQRSATSEEQKLAMLTCLKSYTRADVYLSLMRAGAVRVDIDGTSVTTATMQEKAYARGRMAQIHEHTV